MQQLAFASLTGRGFSLDETTVLQGQTRLLAEQLKLSSVGVWGKLLGAKADYIVLRCHGKDLLGTGICGQVVVYSIDGGLHFTALDTTPNPEKDDVCGLIQGHFMGDAAYEYKVTRPSTGAAVAIREAERLSWFVRTCDHHCRVCPRGAVLQCEDGTVCANKTFEGLDRDVSGRTDSFVHLRADRSHRTALQSEGVNRKLDFLDPITLDEPKAVWQVRYDAELDAVYGTSALLLGAVFYHVPESKTWGSIYVGSGTVNTNLAFML